MPRILNVFWWVKWTEDSTKSFTRTGQLFGHGPIVVKDAGDATLFLISSTLMTRLVGLMSGSMMDRAQLNKPSS